MLENSPNSSVPVSLPTLSPNGRRSRVEFFESTDDGHHQHGRAGHQRISSKDLREATPYPNKHAPKTLTPSLDGTDQAIVVINDEVDTGDASTNALVAESSPTQQAHPRYSACGSGVLARSASTSALQSAGNCKKDRTLVASGKRHFKCSEVEKACKPVMQIRQAEHAQSWDNRHHLAGCENALLPKAKRAYFSRPTSLPDLKKELTRRSPSQARSILKRLETDELPAVATNPITADAGPAICPARHVFGGKMRDRDGEVRPWNDRWHTGMHIINDSLHPSHRGGFSTKSLFESVPSQNWRRHQDFETEHGVWKSIQTRRHEPFGPMGV